MLRTSVGDARPSNYLWFDPFLRKVLIINRLVRTRRPGLSRRSFSEGGRCEGDPPGDPIRGRPSLTELPIPELGLLPRFN